MGALDGFYDTWSKAKDTFGVGNPTDGSQYDGSSKLMQMKAGIESAAPDDRWQGSGSDAYRAANKDHASVYEKLAELDKKMAAEVKNASNVVTTGRTNLDGTKSWVDAAVASLPPPARATAKPSWCPSPTKASAGSTRSSETPTAKCSASDCGSPDSRTRSTR